MSARETVDTRARLLTYARWVAIGLACIAALIIAADSGGGALRIAAFLAVIAVVLVVLSITLNGASSTKLHLEETLLDEIDMLREDVRADITTAARATHRALAERVAHLNENLDQVRRQVDERALNEARAARPTVAPPPQRRAIAGPGVPVVHTETVHVTTQTYVDPIDDPRAAGFVRPPTRRPERDDYAEPMRPDRGRADIGRADVGRPDAGRPDMGRDMSRPEAARGGVGRGDLVALNGPRADPRREAGRGDTGGRAAGSRAEPMRADVGRDADRGEPGRTDFGADRIRQRETHVDDARRRGDDRQSWSDRSDSPSAGRTPVRDPREESWSEQRLRELVSQRAADPYEEAAERDWRGGRDADDPGDDAHWSAMRSGDRWAEVRTDERGRELRMGERRTAVRADETGTQMRIVDRWSSVRQENLRYDDHDSAGRHDASGHCGWDDESVDERGSDTRGSRSRGAEAWGSDGRDRASAFRGGSDNTGETRSERRRREEAEEISGQIVDDRRSGRRAADDVDAGRWSASERSRLALPASGPESAAGWVRGRSDEARDDSGDHRWGGSRGDGHRAESSRSESSRLESSRSESSRSAREISGELVRRSPTPPESSARRAEHGRSEQRSDQGWSEAFRVPEQRSAPREARPADSRSSGAGRPSDHRPADSRRGDGWAAEPPLATESRVAESHVALLRQAAGRRGDARPADARAAERDGGRGGHGVRDAREDNRWEREPSGGRSAVRPRLEFDDTDDRWR